MTVRSSAGTAAALIGIAVVVVACTGSDSPAETTEAVTSTSTTVAAMPTADEVHAAVGPSVAYVASDIGSGSGVLVEPGLILTAAHVVWPYEEVRVVFANGTEIIDARVVGRDLLSDLAIIDVAGERGLPEAAPIDEGEAINPGRPAYLIGYPGEAERFPQPTITQGILSRLRQWEALDWTYLQSDAPVVGGQSGGALVSEDGGVIGITNFSFTDRFGLSGSISDALIRVDAMRSGDDPSGLGDRLPPTTGGEERQSVEIRNVWDDALFVFEAPLYSEVDIRVESDADVALDVITIDGFDVASADDSTDGTEEVTPLITDRGPHLVRVSSFADQPIEAVLRSSVPLAPWNDPDDGSVLQRQETLVGNVDYPGDVDWYPVQLGRGQSVTVEVEAVAFDPAAFVDGPEAAGLVRAVDADSGGGPFGTDPRLVYTADDTGTYLIVVSDSASTGPGAYYLTID